MGSAPTLPSKYETREAWLIALAEALKPMFEQSGFAIPEIRISCSWPSRSIRKRLGECWHSTAAKDGRRHIFITPLAANSLEVASVVVHELLHAALPDDAGHKSPFKRGMKALGLEGKPTSTYAGEELTNKLRVIILTLGSYPHKELTLKDVMGKKQGTRMLKLTCLGCGYVVRTTAKWIETGLPTCACGEQFTQEVS